MSSIKRDRPLGLRLAAAISASFALALAGCSAASPAASVTSSASAAASIAASQAVSASAAASVSASVAPSGDCAVTPDAAAAATVTIQGFSFGAASTINAGQAIAFTNADGVNHTVTQGTEGVAADGACVNEFVAGGATLVVTFKKAGGFDITCRLHKTMHTTVHVQ